MRRPPVRALAVSRRPRDWHVARLIASGHPLPGLPRTSQLPFGAARAPATPRHCWTTALVGSTTCVIQDAHPYGLHDSVCRQATQRMVGAAWSGGCCVHAPLTARRQCAASSSEGSTTVSKHSILGRHSAAHRVCRRPLLPRPPFVLPPGSLPMRVAGLRKPRTMRCHRIPDLLRCPSARASGT